MANYYEDNEDLRFYIEKAINWEPVVKAVERDFTSEGGFNTVEEAKEFYIEVLSMVGNFVAEEITPRVAAVDRVHNTVEDGEVALAPEMDEIFRQIGELGLHTISFPRELGGMNAPTMIYMITSELIARGDVSMMTHFAFHCGIGLVLLMYSVLEGSTEFDPETLEITSTRFQEAIDDIMSGKDWGSMDITEPNAGSDMAALSTKAEQDQEGNWFLTGEKCFITSGNGKHHVVIARSEEPDAGAEDAFSGLKGLSLFWVPAYEDTPEGRKRFIQIDRVEEKIGHHASPTCALVFDRTPGHLIGKRGDGFKLMLKLMNNARISVGFESLGVCEAALRISTAYAAERRSMGKSIDQHEMIFEYLETMKTETQAVRALLMESAYLNERTVRAEFRVQALGDRDPEQSRRYAEMSKRYEKKTRRYTPLVKFYAAEKAVEHARMAMQIHGGSGYTTEYGAEKLLRDALVLPIYEGTTQIQALMATKDTLMEIARHPQDLVKESAQARWRSVTVRDPLERKVAKIQALCLGAQQNLISRVAGAKFKALHGVPLTAWASTFMNWDPKVDFAPALLHAERLTTMLTDVAIAEILMKQARKYPERRELLERFVERALPRAQYCADIIATTGDRILDKLYGREPAAKQAAPAA
jgi:hypothetical protein